MSTIVAIIDDDQAIRGGVSSLLRSVGFDVRLYESAEAFLADDQASSANVALTDIQMPGMSGLDFQAVMKYRQPELPILFMTAFPEDALRQRVLADGAVCFLSKPFKPSDLIYWINVALA